MTKIYQMYDRLAEQAGPTFEAVNDAVALRGLRSTGRLTKILSCIA